MVTVDNIFTEVIGEIRPHRFPIIKPGGCAKIIFLIFSLPGKG